MSITLQATGLEEVQEYLDGLIERLASKEFWNPELRSMMEEAREFAASDSPVVTGSYRDAHEVTVAEMQARLSIDPTATNAGMPVALYAADVEERHQVYAHTAAYARGRAVEAAEDIGRKLIDGN